MTDETSALIEIERNGLCAMLLATATARETAPEAAHDARYAAAADSIRRIAATIDRVDDGMLMMLASVNEASEGLLSELIAARLTAIGFELPACADALAFFAPIGQTVDRILHRPASTCIEGSGQRAMAVAMMHATPLDPKLGVAGATSSATEGVSLAVSPWLAPYCERTQSLPKR